VRPESAEALSKERVLSPTPVDSKYSWFYGFVFFSVESYGRKGLPSMKPLYELGDEAAGLAAEGVKRPSFVAGALCEISIGIDQYP
jgi:hypothetical protein